MKTNYIIVSCECEDLHEHVQEQINKGWHPLGGLAATPNGKLHQAMYRRQAADASKKKRWWHSG